MRLIAEAFTYLEKKGAYFLKSLACEYDKDGKKDKVNIFRHISNIKTRRRGFKKLKTITKPHSTRNETHF